MDHAVVARALHLLGFVLWIGGDGFVNTVLLLAVRRMKSAEERVAFFRLNDATPRQQANRAPARRAQMAGNAAA